MALTPIQQPQHLDGSAPFAPRPDPLLKDPSTGQYKSVIMTGERIGQPPMNYPFGTNPATIGGAMESSQAVGPAEAVTPTRLTPVGMGGVAPKKDIDADYDNSPVNDDY